MTSLYLILTDRINLKKIIALNAILCVLFFSLHSFGHKGVLVNTVQTISIQPTSIKVSHVIDCGRKSPLSILPLLDADKNGKISEVEVNKFANELQERIIKRDSSYKAVLNGKTVLIPFQQLLVHHDSSGNNDNVEMIFFKDGLLFNKGNQNLKLEKEGFQIDIPVLMAMVGYSATPEQGHSHPAHIVKMTLQFPDNFKILESSLGFIPSDSPSLLKGIFLTQQQPKVEVSFNVKSPDSSHK